MGKRVVIIGTLDTKGPEIAYLRDRLQALGLETAVVDSGILGEPIGISLEAGRDISHAEAARYAGTTIEASAQRWQPRQGGGRDAHRPQETDPGALLTGQVGCHRLHGRRRGRDGRGGHDAIAGRGAQSAGFPDRFWKALLRPHGRHERYHGRSFHRGYPGVESDRDHDL